MELVQRLPLGGNTHIVGLGTAQLPVAAEVLALQGQRFESGESPVEELDVTLGRAVVKVNSAFHRFDITQLHEPGGPTLLTVPANETRILSDALVGADHPTRKLTVVLPLDATVSNAVLSIPVVGKEQGLTPAVALIFPSFLEAQVTCVEAVRLLVTFACGPSFR